METLLLFSHLLLVDTAPCTEIVNEEKDQYDLRFTCDRNEFAI